MNRDLTRSRPGAVRNFRHSRVNTVIPTEVGIQRGCERDAQKRNGETIPFNSPLNIKGEGYAQHPIARNQPLAIT